MRACLAIYKDPKKHICWHNQAGASLVEMMLACALSIFLIQGVINTYLSNKLTYELQSSIAAMQENGRFATHILSQNLRMAGDSNCDYSLAYLDATDAIHGYQKSPPASIKNKIKKDTDSVVFKRCRFEEGKTAAEDYAFFISATTRKNKLGETIYALYTAPLSGDKTELVPNVTGMRIYYGVWDPVANDIQAYLPADQITDWNHIKGVEIALLLNSENPVLNNEVNYEFSGSLLDKSRYLRKEWNIYVMLREK